MPVNRVGLLAPMQLELAPLVRDLELLETESGEWRGRTPSGVELVALCTNIGMEAARAATNAVVTFDVNHVIVVGIAGATSTKTNIGSLVLPALVVDRATARTFSATPCAGNVPSGTISCGDDLITEAAILETMVAAGVVALDMESAAVGEVCERVGLPWSVFRSISDHAGGGLIDEALFSMTQPDGSADPEAVARAMRDPERKAKMMQLAHDATLAAENAARAAIAALCSM